MKCENLFSGKNEKIFQRSCAENFTQHVKGKYYCNNSNKFQRCSIPRHL